MEIKYWNQIRKSNIGIKYGNQILESNTEIKYRIKTKILNLGLVPQPWIKTLDHH